MTVIAGVMIAITVITIVTVFMLDANRTSTTSSETSLPNLPLATAAQASQTVSAFASGQPLATLRSAGYVLDANEVTLGTCGRAENMLASAGSPSELKEDAARLNDPIASDLSESLVTAEGQVLSDCTGGVTSSDRSELLTVERVLTTRLKQDGMH